MRNIRKFRVVPRGRVIQGLCVYYFHNLARTQPNELFEGVLGLS